MLLNRSVDAAVIENGSDTILAEGLGYDRCQVGIITNIDAPRHFGKFYIETPEQVCNVLRTQVDVVLPDGVAVLNAADPLVAPMAKYCDGEVIFFSRQAESELLAAHLQQGGRAVVVRDGSIVLVAGDEQSELIKLAQVPVLANSTMQCRWTACWLPLLPPGHWALRQELIRAGLTTFEMKLANTKDIA